MKEEFYFHTIRDVTIQFLDILNDIVINRYDSSGAVTSRIPVCVKFAPKEKINYFLNRKKPPRLPLISVFINGITYNRDRMNDFKHSFQIPESILTSAPTDIINIIKNPIPYDISFQCSIWTKYQEDLNQILERILTWTNPFSYIAIKEPITGRIVNCKLYQVDSAPEIEFEYNEEGRGPVLRWGMNFICQTWFWKPAASASIIKFANIYNRIVENTSAGTSARLYSILSLSGISAVSASSGAEVLYEYEKIDKFP